MTSYIEADIRENMRANHEGFSEIDADYLSYFARWIESGKQLNGKHLRKARALMMKYAGRLVELANTQE